MLNLGHVGSLTGIMSDPHYRSYMEEYADWEQRGRKGALPHNPKQKKFIANMQRREQERNDAGRNDAFNSAYRITDEDRARAKRANPRFADGAHMGNHPVWKDGIDPAMRGRQAQEQIDRRKREDDAYRYQLDERRRLEEMDMNRLAPQAPAPAAAPAPVSAPAPAPVPAPAPAPAVGGGEARRNDAAKRATAAANQAEGQVRQMDRKEEARKKAELNDRVPLHVQRNARAMGYQGDFSDFNAQTYRDMKTKRRGERAREYGQQRAQARANVRAKIRPRQRGSDRNTNRTRLNHVPGSTPRHIQDLEFRREMLRRFGR